MKHIAFDLGAESGRAIIGELVDGKLTMEELHRFPTQGIYVNGSLRWDIYRLFSELKVALTKFAQRYGDTVCTMGVDTWGVDIGFLDEQGKLISMPYHYRDARNIGTSEKIDQFFGLNRLYNETGIQQLVFNSLNQIFAAKEANDSTLAVADRMLFIGDILHYFLCGSVTSEKSIASTSNLYSVKTDGWVPPVLNAFGISEKWMPEALPAGTPLARIRTDIAKETGISLDCQVIAPTIHDTAAAATAVPGTGDIAYISSGTWSLVGLELKQPFVNDEAKEQNVANYAGAFGRILFIKNVMGLWLIQQARKQWRKTNDQLGYGDIVKLAEDAKEFYGYIDPNDDVFLNPENMPAEVCVFLNRTGQKQLDPNDVGQVARIIFESLAFKYREVFNALAKVTGKTYNHLNIIGGGIQNKMLTQFTANALGIKVSAGPIEATAVGNILMQCKGTGEIESIEQLRKVVRDTFNPEVFNPRDIDIWNEKYLTFINYTNAK